jgi:hypothetical protein
MTAERPGYWLHLNIWHQDLRAVGLGGTSHLPMLMVRFSSRPSCRVN